jgi:hypothetical protein
MGEHVNHWGTTTEQGVSSGYTISVAIMHHPSRADFLPSILARCEGLETRVITDPEPAAPPNPIRAARIAWRSMPAGATHHLVLQDDVVLVEGFVERLREVVAGRPDDITAVYSNWNSVQNTYLIRCAVAAGLAWAPLSHNDYTPSLGVVMPVAHARAFAEHLDTLAPAVREDDEHITVYCRERGIRAVAAIPHLLDHGDIPTVAGTAGTYQATVLLPVRPPVTAGHWAGESPAEKALSVRAQFGERLAYSVDVADSRCTLRLIRLGTAEPREHPFGWYWRDWAELVGIGPADIVAGLAGSLPAFLEAGDVSAETVDLVAELWAAAFVLGRDAQRIEDAPVADPSPFADAYLRDMLRRWALRGYGEDLPPAGLDLVAMAAAALAEGRRFAREPRPQASLAEAAAVEHPAVAAMAEREARLLTSFAPALFPSPIASGKAPVVVAEVITCPACGLGASEAAARRHSRLVDDTEPVPGRPAATLRLLGCEVVEKRSLMPIFQLLAAYPQRRFTFASRSVRWLASAAEAAGLDGRLALVERSERWADDVAVPPAEPADEILTLPMSTRSAAVPVRVPASDASAVARLLDSPSHFLTVHAEAGVSRFEDSYRADRTARVLRLLTTENPLSRS